MTTGISRIELPKILTHQTAARFYTSVSKKISKSKKGEHFEMDFSALEEMDSSAATVLTILKHEAAEQGLDLAYINVSAKIKQAIELFSVEIKEAVAPVHTGFFERLGTEAWQQLHWAYQMILLTSNVFYWFFKSLFNKKLRRKGEVIQQNILIGVNAFPIIALIAFLIGFILALQSAIQLRQFGANIFVADLVAVAMVSEMGPLITAIMVAGRSGSAIAAEIATMQVSEEIDALKVMGIDPIPYLVVPKVMAILTSLPMLTIFANVIGILGGMVIGITYLDLDIIPFFNEVAQVTRFKEIFIGLLKSVVFSIIIVLTGVFFGFRVRGGAEGVGKATTAAVVFSIFMVIVADSIIGLVFYFGD